MSDIVERLRACHGIISGDPECCCEEAAAEIERLMSALRKIEHETGETTLATNQGRHGKIAHEIARHALEGK